MRYSRTFGLLLVIAALLSGCDFFGPSGGGVVIRVGKSSISPEAFKEEMQRFALDLDLDSAGLKQVMDSLVDSLVERLTIQEYARKHSIEVSEAELETAIGEIKKGQGEKDFQESLLRACVDFDEWKEGLRRRLLFEKVMERIGEQISPVGFQEIKEYYDSHQDEFKRPAMLKFRQIVTRTGKEAKEVLKRLKAGEKMSDLAAEYSILPYIEDETQVSWVTQEDLEDPMGKVLFSLPLGKPSAVTKTSYGYHIFVVFRKRGPGIVGLPDATAEIEAKLLRAKRETFYRNWMEGLKKKYSVYVNRELITKLERG
ncbi:MAG: peptidyl-prolyl cis-trans isomerase [Deltaproteobacteria bacterium]|nr:peptidyl-prolyl cis-trans isomerase [Deltaproteobacteria bacterium]